MITRLSDDTKKVTANQLAKEVILDRLDLIEYVFETFPDCYKRMTDLEKEKVWDAIEKQRKRVQKLLGLK